VAHVPSAVIRRAVSCGARLSQFSSKSKPEAILEAALLPYRLKFVILLGRLLWHVTRFGFTRSLGPISILRLLLGFFIEHDALAGFGFHVDLLRCGMTHDTGSRSNRNFWSFSEFPRFIGSAFLRELEHAMEAVYFFGAFLLLVALIYWTLSYHYRDRRKSKIADQIVRDRYEHNRT
jgi:hypothetical protein